jgi:acetyl esterase/lipase
MQLFKRNSARKTYLLLLARTNMFNRNFFVLASALGSAAAITSSMAIGVATASNSSQLKNNNIMTTNTNQAASSTVRTAASIDNYSNIEPKTRAFLENLEKQGGPPIYTLAPEKARAVLSSVQAAPLPPGVNLPPADIENRTLPGGPDGSQVSVNIVRPQGSSNKTLPVVLYIHGGGWVLGGFDTHERLVREFANKANVTVVFVNYTPAPDAHYPVQIEQAYAALKWVAENGKSINVDPSRLAVVGDSVGGNMAAAVTLLAKERRGPDIKFQELFYPVTDAKFDTPSYITYNDGPWLARKGMEWFWKNYLPDNATRNQPTASPLRASLDQLKGLPPALIIVDENDVLRDEGEAYAHKLMQANVTVTATRYLGTIHDFMMLNPISDTPPVRGAIDQATDMLKKALVSSTTSAAEATAAQAQ